MEIILAKTAGFCFGVDRAVRMTEQLAASKNKVATLGPLIHNPQCVAALEAQQQPEQADAAIKVPRNRATLIDVNQFQSG